MVTTEAVKNIIIETIDLDMLAQDIADDSVIVGEGLELDSVDVLDIIVSLEKRLNVKLRDQQMKKADFANVKALTDFVNQMLAPRTLQ